MKRSNGMKKVQNCNVLTHKHIKETIDFPFIEIKKIGRWNGTTIRKEEYSGYRLRFYGIFQVRRFGYFNHLSNRILIQMIHHLKALM